MLIVQLLDVRIDRKNNGLFFVGNHGRNKVQAAYITRTKNAIKLAGYIPKSIVSNCKKL